MLELALDPDNVDAHPRRTSSARLLPKTLFGERYVALQVPPTTDAEPIAAGAVIGQDRTRDARSSWSGCSTT